jgi:hypothetical protein
MARREGIGEHIQHAKVPKPCYPDRDFIATPGQAYLKDHR